MSLQKIILHIGTPKTGSTALQIALTRQRQALLEQGIFFPATSLLGEVTASTNLQDLTLYAADPDRVLNLRSRRALSDETTLQVYRTTILTKFRQLQTTAEKSGCHTLVLSAEGLYEHLRRSREFDRLAVLLGNLGPRLNILVWLRRQDHYLLSRVSQAAKSGTRTIDVCCEMGDSYDYAGCLARWHQAFPAAKLSVLPYQRNSLQDFCRHIELPVDFLSAQSNPVNTSLSANAVALLAALASRVPLLLPDGRRNPQREGFQSRIEAIDKLRGGVRLSLSLIGRRRLLKTCSVGNQQLSTLYRKGQPFFDLSDLGQPSEWSDVASLQPGETLLPELSLPELDSPLLLDWIAALSTTVPNKPAAPGSTTEQGDLYLLHGLKRSGNHALVHWLHAQMDFHFFNNITPIAPLLRSNSPMPPPQDFAKWLTDRRQNDQRLSSQVLASLEDHDLRFLPFKNVGRTQRSLLILRHPDNLFSSRIKKAFSIDSPAYPRTNGPLMQRSVSLWKQHAREYLGQTHWLKNRIAIYFDAWFMDVAYRRAISTALGLSFDDRAFTVVSSYGGGSSFAAPGTDQVGALQGVTSRLAQLLPLERELFEQVCADPELIDLRAAVQSTDPLAKLLG